jgi:hypothetical protein
MFRGSLCEGLFAALGELSPGALRADVPAGLSGAFFKLPFDVFPGDFFKELFAGLFDGLFEPLFGDSFDGLLGELFDGLFEGLFDGLFDGSPALLPGCPFPELPD